MLSYKIQFKKTQYNQYKEMTCNVQNTEIRQLGSEYKHLFGNNRKISDQEMFWRIVSAPSRSSHGGMKYGAMNSRYSRRFSRQAW